jgi:hypothetical protein
VHVIFVDDSAQKGRRRGMGQLLALGGVILPEEAIAPYSAGVDKIYDTLGVPGRTEMKWNVPDGNFLKTAPAGVRQSLYGSAIDLAAELNVRSVVVVWDTGRTSLQGDEAKRRVLQYLYERVSVALDKLGGIGVVVADKPGGGPKDEAKWLSRTLDLTDYGTEFVKPDKIVMAVVTAPSHHLRHLQLADVVVSATTAAVAGGNQFSQQLVPALMKIAHRNALGYVGGAGIKLFPNELINLHHWAFGEDTFAKVAMSTGWQLPWREWEYATDDGLTA